MNSKLIAFVAVVLGVSSAMTTASAAQAEGRIEINGAPLDDAGRQVLRRIETVIGPVPAGRYWYDAASGGAGVWNGPASAYIGPGLALGPPLPAAASGGGNGRVTGVFVNGRELHPIDVAGLSQVLAVQRGRYWWDPSGNVGLEGGPMLFNFYWVIQQQRNASGGTYKPGPRPGESTYVGKGCAAVHGRLRAGDESSGYSYYVGC